VTFAGQLIVGGCTSLTVTVKEHPGPEFAEQLTVVVPRWKKEPEGGKQTTLPQAPLPVGAA
jgi:hypothetical protein